MNDQAKIEDYILTVLSVACEASVLDLKEGSPYHLHSVCLAVDRLERDGKIVCTQSLPVYKYRVAKGAEQDDNRSRKARVYR